MLTQLHVCWFGPSCPDRFLPRHDFSFSDHVTEVLVSCTHSLYAIRILKFHGLSSDSLHMVKPQLYCGCSTLPLLGMATRSPLTVRMERLLSSLVRMDYLPKDSPNLLDLVYKSELALLDACIFDSYHVFRYIFSLSSSDVLAFASAATPLSCHSKILRTSYPMCSTDPSSPITPPNDPSISCLPLLPSD